MTDREPTDLQATILGRQKIAALARVDGETTFAREVLAGCWDQRNDVKTAIAKAQTERNTP